jgi:MOSC domain-containing protein YiiM
MAILRPSGLIGKIEAILINHTLGSETNATERDHVRAGYGGFEGDNYASLTRPACVRTKAQYAIGTPIRNVRQLTIVSAEELIEIGAAMGLPEPVRPGWVRANLVVSGLPRFTEIPPASRLLIEGGAGLAVDMENEACAVPGRLIEQAYPGFGKHFRNAALGKRGVTAWVEREGEIKLGAAIALHIPPQRLYQPAMAA